MVAVQRSQADAHRRHPIFTVARGVAALLFLLFIPAQVASANGHVQTSVIDPTPTNGASGDEVTITFEGPADTAAGRADVTKAKKCIDDAVANSADMRAKIAKAGGGHGNKITIKLKRDNPKVFVGEITSDSNEIRIDLGDIEAIETEIRANGGGTAAKREKVAKGFCIRVLAHELEHAKDDADNVDDNGAAPGNDELDHRDPGSGSRTAKGPAVKDANKVLSQFPASAGMTSDRKQYVWSTPTGSKIEFNGGTTVTFDVSKAIKDRAKVNKFVGSPDTYDELNPFVIFGIPESGCVDVGYCFPPTCGPDSGDEDCDGVDDVEDNCLGNANPWQADFDDDGNGQGCDLDDDGDGLLDAVETDTGIFVGPDDTGSDPFDRDTDDDSVPDFDEVQANTDPSDPGDFAAGLPGLAPLGLGLLAAALLGLGVRRRLR